MPSKLIKCGTCGNWYSAFFKLFDSALIGIAPTVCLCVLYAIHLKEKSPAFCAAIAARVIHAEWHASVRQV